MPPNRQQPHRLQPPIETNVFPGSSHQSFHGAGFNTAGRDMTFMPTINVNLASTATVPTLAISTDGPTTRLPLLIGDTFTPHPHPVRASRANTSTATRIPRPIYRPGQRERRRPSHHDQSSNQGLTVDSANLPANRAEGTIQRSASSSGLVPNDDDISVVCTSCPSFIRLDFHTFFLSRQRTP
jgi:hypothetical protein